MEPGGFIPGAEAQRWFSISERLLSSGDFLGCKTFAIRARESDPRFDLVDQILAVADTLIAGERLVNNNQRDWYSILQLVGQTDDSELIASQYSRLALLLKPHRNTLPLADQAFRLVFEAWSVLSNPAKKTLYDNMLEFYTKLNLNPPGSTSYEQENQEQQQWQQQQQQPRQQQQQQPQQQQQQPQQQQQQQQLKQNSQSDRNIPPGIQEENASAKSSHDQSSTFWTACPYCFHMYEYLNVYVDCTLRCQKCERAFHAVGISSPPQVDNGEDVYFYCWGYFPLGITESNLRRINGGGMDWTPFSPLLSCLHEMDKNGVDGNVNVARKKKSKSSAPRIYVDEEDAFVEISDSSDDSDDDWNGPEKKKAKSVKNKGRPAKNVKKSQVDNANNARGGSGINLNPQSGVAVKEGQGASNMSKAESLKKVTSNAAKRTGKVAKEWGRLDLNVEFNNEVEEPARRMNVANVSGNGVEDNIEGTEFFEGLDEFLNSLPILSVVNDKVKTT